MDFDDLMRRAKQHAQGNQEVAQIDHWRAYRRCPNDEEFSGYFERRTGLNLRKDLTSILLDCLVTAVTALIFVPFSAVVSAILFMLVVWLFPVLANDTFLGICIFGLVPFYLVFLMKWVSPAILHKSTPMQVSCIVRQVVRDIQIWWHVRHCTFCRSQFVAMKQFLPELKAMIK